MMASGAAVAWASAARGRWAAHERTCLACGLDRRFYGGCPEGREIQANHEAAQRVLATEPDHGGTMTAQVPVERHPGGCAFCPAELLGLERDRNGDPLCQTCPHLRDTASREEEQERMWKR